MKAMYAEFAGVGDSGDNGGRGKRYTFEDVVRATVYVADMSDFPTLNVLYAAAMGVHRPARSTVQVAALPKGAMVEIDLIAKLPDPN